MRMCGLVVLRTAGELEAPQVIAEIGSRGETDVGEIHEIAIERRAIVAERGEAIADVCMRERSVGVDQTAQDRRARGRRAQAHGPQPLLQILSVRGLLHRAVPMYTRRLRRAQSVAVTFRARLLPTCYG